MSSKEDILEQLVEEFLVHRGYFVQHNVKFLPNKKHSDYNPRTDSNHSDIDVLGINPKLKGDDRIWAVSCKSWQAGFSPEKWISRIDEEKIFGGREAWKSFRELVSPKWSEGFVQAIVDATGSAEFTYVTAVTRMSHGAEKWESRESFRNAMNGNPIRVITLEEMLREVSEKLTKTLAGTEFGRTLQLFKAAGLSF